MVTEESLREGTDIDEMISQFDVDELNLYTVNEELESLVRADLIDEEEADMVRSVIVYIFMKKKDFDPEDLYALVFGKGKRIRWH
jgi:hypothetical protein